MAKKKTIRTIPQSRTPMPEQEPEVRARNFAEVACGYSPEDALREADRCLECPDEPCVRGCPVGVDIPGFIQRIAATRPARRLRHAHRHQPAARGVRPRLPAGEPVRRRLHGRRHARAGRDRQARALRRRHRDPRGLGQRAVHRAGALSGRHRRLGTGGNGVRGRHGQGRLRGHGLRGVPPARRRAALRHPRLPPAQRGDRRRDRQPRQARRQVRVQHARRAPLHDRADDRGARLRRGLHRRRRGLPVDARHPRRLAQRRAVGQRAADALQPDAGARLPGVRHAGAGRQARRRGRRRQHRDGRDARVAAARRRKGLLHLSPLAHRSAGAPRGGAPRRAGRRRVPLADESGGGARRRQGQRARPALRAHDARRARRLGPPAAGRGAGQRVRLRDRPRGLRDRHQRQSDHGPDLRDEAQRARLHRDRRRARHLARGRLRGRRHRHRRGHRDPGDGRRPARRAQHEALPRPARQRRRRQAGRRCSASTSPSAASRACAAPERSGASGRLLLQAHSRDHGHHRQPSDHRQARRDGAHRADGARPCSRCASTSSRSSATRAKARSAAASRSARSPRAWATASGRPRSSRPRSGRRRAASPARAATGSASAPGRSPTAATRPTSWSRSTSRCCSAACAPRSSSPAASSCSRTCGARTAMRRSPPSYVEAHDKLVAAGYRVIEIPMEQECKALVADAKRGKNMFVLGMLCQLYSLDLQIAREQIALTFGKKDESVVRTNVMLLGAGHAWAATHLDFGFRIPARAYHRAAARHQRQHRARARRAWPRAWRSARCTRSRRPPRRRTT